MDLKHFAQQVEAMGVRLEQFFNEAEGELSAQNPLAARSKEELQTMFEELQVASEQLNQQNTELAELSLALEAERQRYIQLFQLAPVGYILTNQHGKILEANGAAAELLNVPETQLPGKSFVLYIAVEDKKRFRLKLAQMAEDCTGGPEPVKNWEVRLQPRKRDILFVSLNAAVSPDELNPSGCSLLWSIRDISGRVKVQSDLEIANRELEQRVIERTVQLSKTNEKLRSYVYEIEKQNREMQDFTFIASHDLQEPLRKIRLFGDLLRNKYRDQLAEEGAEYIDRMTGAANRMQDMVNGLLSYSRVSTRSAPFVPVDLNRLATDVLLDLDYRIHRLGGEVELDELPVIEADPMQMRTLFTNLIDNSLKFRRKDIPPEIKIWAEKDLKKVRLYFQDNGIGIDLEHFQGIFQPFQRSHSRQEFQGTGMGLAICRKIVERHGGEISARSTPGEGSTFILTLPVKQHE